MQQQYVECINILTRDPSPGVREKSGTVLPVILLCFETILFQVGKKLRHYMLSLTKQLDYTHKDGRMSALELITTLVSKLPADVLAEYFLVFFLSLSSMMASDEDAQCRKG